MIKEYRSSYYALFDRQKLDVETDDDDVFNVSIKVFAFRAGHFRIHALTGLKLGMLHGTSVGFIPVINIVTYVRHLSGYAGGRGQILKILGGEEHLILASHTGRLRAMP